MMIQIGDVAVLGFVGLAALLATIRWQGIKRVKVTKEGLDIHAADKVPKSRQRN